MESQTGVQMPGSPLLSEMIREEILDGEISTESPEECAELCLNSEKTSVVHISCCSFLFSVYCVKLVECRYLGVHV